MPSDDPAPPPGQPATRLRETAIPRDVRKALELMRASAGELITEAGLAAACGVAERTLRKHFRRFIGRSPLAHLRRLRLAAARADLLASEGRLSVTAIATRHGFIHLGRFAAGYARRFGEPPSATLARGRNEAGEREEDRQRAAGRGKPGQASAADGSRPHRPHYAPPGQVLAVLPFELATGREEAEFAADLLAQLGAALCRLHGISVVLVPPVAPAARGGPHQARDFAAGYCLAGRITRAAECVRVILRLTDAPTGAHLWGDCYDGTSAAPLALLDRIAQDVPDSVSRSLRQDAITQAALRHPGALDAGDIVLRATPMLFGNDAADLAWPLGLLDQAMAMNPDHAPAPAPALAAYGHARIFATLPFGGEAGSALLAARGHLLHLAGRAATLDAPGNPLVLTVRGVAAMLDGDGEAADRLLARAVAIGPTTALAWAMRGWRHNACGRTEAAIMEFSRAIRLGSPHTPLAGVLAGIGCSHFIAGRYALAAHWLRRALAANPDAAWINRNRAPSDVLPGERRAAPGALAAMRRAYPGTTVTGSAATCPPIAACRERSLEAMASIGLPA